MRRLLLYADDPGAANYLAPLPPALATEGYDVSFLVNPSLLTFATERGFSCQARPENVTPEELLTGAEALLVGTSQIPDCFGHDLVNACRKLRLPSLGVVDLEVNADKRFLGNSNDPLHYAPDYLAVPDVSSREAFIRLGFNPARIAICGHPHYDQVRARRAELERQDRTMLRQHLFPDAPMARPIWLFLAEGTDQLDPTESLRNDNYTLYGRGTSDARTAIVLEELLDAAAEMSPKPWIALRPHPQNHSEVAAQYYDELDAVYAVGEPLPLVWAADLVVGMSSMLLLEAYLLGRPTLAILPRVAEKAWLPTLVAGLTPVAGTRDELKRLFGSPIEWHAPRSAHDIFPHNCTKRVVDWVSRSLM